MPEKQQVEIARHGAAIAVAAILAALGLFGLWLGATYVAWLPMLTVDTVLLGANAENIPGVVIEDQRDEKTALPQKRGRFESFPYTYTFELRHLETEPGVKWHVETGSMEVATDERGLMLATGLATAAYCLIACFVVRAVARRKRCVHRQAPAAGQKLT